MLAGLAGNRCIALLAAWRTNAVRAAISDQLTVIAVDHNTHTHTLSMQEYVIPIVTLA